MFGQTEILILMLLVIFLMYFEFPIFAWVRTNKTGPVKLMSGPELLFHDGRAAYGKKRYRDAIRMLRHAALIRPERALTHYYLGLSYAALGHFAEAEKAFQETLRLDPLSYNAWSALGDSFHRLNRWEDALGAYRQALQIKPDLACTRDRMQSAYAHLNYKEAA